MVTAIIINICRDQDMGLSRAKAQRECGPFRELCSTPPPAPRPEEGRSESELGMGASLPAPHSLSPIY